MSKLKAIMYCIVSAAGAIVVLAMLPSSLYGCAVPFVIIALWCGIVAGYKHTRDARLIAESHYAEQTVIHEPPPMTSKGSNRLFVPPPLQKK